MEKKLTLREEEIDELQNQLRQQMKLITQSMDPCSSSRSVQSTVNRIEREKDILRTDLERCQIERDDLRLRMKTITETQKSEQMRVERLQQDYLTRIAQLEFDKRELTAVQGPNKSTIDYLRTEIAQLNAYIKEVQNDNSKLKTSYHQVK